MVRGGRMIAEVENQHKVLMYLKGQGKVKDIKKNGLMSTLTHVHMQVK